MKEKAFETLNSTGISHLWLGYGEKEGDQIWVGESAFHLGRVGFW